MELIEGVGFNFLCETRGKQLLDRPVELLIQAAEGIAYFHEQGYIHRDICPRNMMVTTEGVVKLIDFGLAVPNTPQFRRPGNRTGTANYMAPELIRRAPTDQRIDVFSFGVTMYEAFTGGLPWDSAESLQAMLHHLNSPGRDPRELNPNIDDATARVLEKSIERDPNARHQSMKKLIADLKGLIGQEADDA
jgi:serine/threonine protein kinase